MQSSSGNSITADQFAEMLPKRLLHPFHPIVVAFDLCAAAQSGSNLTSSLARKISEIARQAVPAYFIHCEDLRVRSLESTFLCGPPGVRTARGFVRRMRKSPL